MRKFSFPHLCAYVSLTLSLSLALFWACEVGGFEVVSLDTFVGVIVGLLAIIVTFAIGWQIYNAMEINRRIDDLNAKLQEFQGLKRQIDSQHEKIEMLRHEAAHFSHMAIGDTCISNRDFIGAFRFYLSALNHSLKMDVPKNVLQITDAILHSIESASGSQKLVCRLYDEVERMDKEVRNSKLYNMVQDKYEKAYNSFTRKVVRDK